MYWYAKKCPYGITTLSKMDTLLRFESRKLRDAFVRDDAWDGGYHIVSLTVGDARRQFPEAFRHSDWDDPRWEDNAWTGAPSGGGYRDI